MGDYVDRMVTKHIRSVCDTLMPLSVLHISANVNIALAVYI